MKKLELRFRNEDDKVVTFQLDNPVEPVDADLVNEAMDEIIEAEAFSTPGGKLLIKESARVVEQKVEEIKIV